VWQACCGVPQALMRCREQNAGGLLDERRRVSVRADAKRKRSAGVLPEYLEGVRKSMRVAVALHRVAAPSSWEDREVAERHAGRVQANAGATDSIYPERHLNPMRVRLNPWRGFGCRRGVRKDTSHRRHCLRPEGASRNEK